MFCLVVAPACSRFDNKQSATTSSTNVEAPQGQSADGPPADVVQATAAPLELTTGRSTDASVNVKIAPGYHINGNPASTYQIATTLVIEASAGITSGTPTYPKAISKKFSFSNEPIVVYEGEVVIRQPLIVDVSSPNGTRSLRAKLRVQPCDEKVCYPPRTLDVAIPATVR